MIARILKSVRNGESLSKRRGCLCCFLDLDGIWTPAHQGFLMGLSQRGETSAEISGAAQVLRERASFISAPDGARLIVNGTGGDQSNSLNISTAVAFVVASCGVPVAKQESCRQFKIRRGGCPEEIGINLDLSCSM